MALDLVADAKAIIESLETFGLTTTWTDPSGTQGSMVGLPGEIGLTMDSETGMSVAGARAYVSVHLSSFRAVFGATAIPLAISSRTSKPWLVQFADYAGVQHTYKVIDVMPDMRLGVVTCLVEAYKS